MTDKKQRLLKLERSGNYVFHGSPVGDIKILKPKQGKYIPDMKKIYKKIDDGKPSVSATPYLEIAIFRAIVNSKNVKRRSILTGFGYNLNKGIDLRVSSKKILDDAYNNSTGYIYIFNKKDFEPYNREEEAKSTSMEWRSYKAIKPIETVRITGEDLIKREFIQIVKK